MSKDIYDLLKEMNKFIFRFSGIASYISVAWMILLPFVAYTCVLYFNTDNFASGVYSLNQIDDVDIVKTLIFSSFVISFWGILAIYALILPPIAYFLKWILNRRKIDSVKINKIIKSYHDGMTPVVVKIKSDLVGMMTVKGIITEVTDDHIKITGMSASSSFSVVKIDDINMIDELIISRKLEKSIGTKLSEERKSAH